MSNLYELTNNENNINEEKNIDIENNTIENCVICLEPVNNISETSRFNCDHAKYMHNDCVKTLRKCPLCRELSIIPVDSYNRNNKYSEKILCFIITTFFSIMVFILMYPIVYYGFGSGKYKNNTMYNDTMYNNTMYNNTMYYFNIHPFHENHHLNLIPIHVANHFPNIDTQY